MLAVDTNVVVRLFVADDMRQAVAARSLLEQGPIWIAKTVLLETEWVLRHVYSYDAEAVVNSIRALLGYEHVVVEDTSAVAEALALTAHGVGFADALHLSSRFPGAEFVTFDRKLARRAQRAGSAKVSEL